MTSLIPYAELHAHSSFSFLDGASGPAELIAEAEQLGLSALAITDHDGLYGAVRFAEAAKDSSVQTVYGAELSIGLEHPRVGIADPGGEHLLVLARGIEGYHRLAGEITRAHLRGGAKGHPRYDITELAQSAAGHWQVLTGCRKGSVQRGLARDDAETPLRLLIDLFGSDSVAVELTDHGLPQDTVRNSALYRLAKKYALPTVATNAVHYATPAQGPLADAIAAVRAGISLDQLDGYLPGHHRAHLRSGAEINRWARHYPGSVSASIQIAQSCAFPLRNIHPALPQPEVPSGHTPISYLREKVWAAVPERYPQLSQSGRERIERELSVIEEKDFPGYFLIVDEIVQEARRRNILCQGRGSAAASAVCYLLGITAVDPIGYNLPFERFLATTREEEPDIDVDFDSDRREEIIQWVFQRYGRERAAQVATVIQYRPKNAVRDMSRALGFAPGQQDAWAAQVSGRRSKISLAEEHTVPAQVLQYSQQLLQAPRHLGIHTGGMVLTARPIGEIVPVEHARMVDRTIIQWDKDDTAWMGLVKFDLLGLGILSALQHSFDLIKRFTAEIWTLASIPKEEAGVYNMLCGGHAIGVFQVESRAQLNLLPRLRPRSFEDLAAQIALIRPGPLQGGAVHPYVRRRLGKEPVSYPHPDVIPILEHTLGIPIFQEQLIKMASVLGDCSADEADQLRRAMGSKRGIERIEKIKNTLFTGMAKKGISPEDADRIYAQIQAFSGFGFAESHSLSFALLVYASAWLKLHYPAAFLAGLLRAQPMGFYSPATLTTDARRKGVETRRPDLQLSGALASLEPAEQSTLSVHAPTGMDSCLVVPQLPVGKYQANQTQYLSAHRRDGAAVVRLGLSDIRGIGAAVARRIVTERDHGGHYRTVADLVRRVDLNEAQVSALARSGALECLGSSRRQSLWEAGPASQDRAQYLAGTAISVQPPLFTDQSSYEQLSADLRATGISVDDHPMAHFRGWLSRKNVLPSAVMHRHEAGRRVRVAGLVTHRQRPSTAGGITFITLEDEHGSANIVCSVGVWRKFDRVARQSSALIVTGRLERSSEGVSNILADTLEHLDPGVAHQSRDFR